MLKYTESQKEAITAPQRDVLISAAAGSGKTRVLTERVVQLVRGADPGAFRNGDAKTDPARMADIRHMLMVTFTRAAASEMRTRIVGALGQAAAREEDPETARRLHAQAEAAAGADITTFHGFCRKVIAENYEAAGVSANFGILGSAQGQHLRTACLRQTMDEMYEQELAASDGAPDQQAPGTIRRLLMRYGANGSDESLSALISSLYDQMMGQPDPHGWLEMSLEDPEARLNRLYALRAELLPQRIRLAHEFMARLVAQETHDFPVLNTTGADAAFLAQLEAYLADPAQAPFPASFPAIRRNKAMKESDVLAPLQDLRNQTKKAFLEAKDLLTERDRARDLADLRHTQEDVRALTGIVRRFEEIYSQHKQAANKVDFSDLEHKTLQVLRLYGSRYAERYQHIFVDEYQDTSPVQDAILEAIHLDSDGKPLNHQFLVGDMKQSIYRFRNADPRIFEGRSRRYAAEKTGSQRRIIMNENFRSGPAVIEGVNGVMGALMDESLGEISYEGEELVCGRQQAVPGVFEILLTPETEENAAAELRQLQAEMIADKIAVLQADGRSLDDIAVLFRSRSDLLWLLADALEARGIPALTQSGASAVYVEIDIFLHLLRLVINDRQDIPLLSVLRSFLFGFDERDFAYITEWGDKQEKGSGKPFFLHLLHFFHKGGEEGPARGADAAYHADLVHRVADFYARLARLRAKGTDMSVERFAEEAGERFRFPSYLKTRPNGESRLRMYEALLGIFAELGELHGNSLLRVLNAIDELRGTNRLFERKNDIVWTPGAVRLMTSHGSKGLEFPVVFLAGLEQNFRLTGGRGPILTSSDYGIAAQYTDEETLTRRDTLETELLGMLNKSEELSEELRVLYVSMTRPQEELYLCASVGDRGAARKRWQQVKDEKHTAKSAIEWIMSTDPAVPERRGQKTLKAPDGPDAPRFDWKKLEWQLLETKPAAGLQSSPVRTVRIEAQRSVSEMVQTDHRREKGAPRRQSLFAPVLGEEEDITAARRGTIVHRLMQYALTHGLQPDEALGAMRENLLITEKEAGALTGLLPAVRQFFASPLYVRLQKSPRVLTEQRFRLLMDADEVDGTISEDGRVRVQGMIDLAFREEDGWVLIDYKTDSGVSEEEMAQRYEEQLNLYARALEEITGLPVKEKMLFSFAMGRGITLS